MTPVFFGHHKAGTTWLQRVIKANCRKLGLSYRHYHGPGQFNYDFSSVIGSADFIGYTNADFFYVQPFLEGIRGFHVVRDPRDIVVSAYFSHLTSHPTDGWPELAEKRACLRQCSREEGLEHTMAFLKDMPLAGDKLSPFQCMSDWNYETENIKELRFEEIVASPYNRLVDIFEFLGLATGKPASLRQMIQFLLLQSLRKHLPGPTVRLLGRNPVLPLSLLLEAVYKNDFEAITGRRRGTEDTSHHFRKGLPGEWRTHFTPKHRSLFKELFGDIVVKLGYEPTNDW